jgi:Carboxypeptidase regulatory-like domain
LGAASTALFAAAPTAYCARPPCGRSFAAVSTVSCFYRCPAHATILSNLKLFSPHNPQQPNPQKPLHNAKLCSGFWNLGKKSNCTTAIIVLTFVKKYVGLTLWRFKTSTTLKHSSLSFIIFTHLNHFNMKTILTTLFLAFSSLFAYAQTSFSGKVTDEKGEALFAANVVILKNDTLLVSGTETDFDGNYSMSGLDPGTYDVRCTYTDNKDYTIKRFIIKNGRANTLDFKMQMKQVFSDNIVEIYKAQPQNMESCGGGRVLTAKEVAAMPTKNLESLVTGTGCVGKSDRGKRDTAIIAKPQNTELDSQSGGVVLGAKEVAAMPVKKWIL